MRKIVIAMLLCAVGFSQTGDSGKATMTSDGLWLNFPKPDHFVSIMTTGPDLLLIEDRDHNLMVRVAENGKVEYGKDYKPADGAKAFWEELAKAYPEICNLRPPSSSQKPPVTSVVPTKEP